MSRGLAFYHSFTSFFLVMFSFISAWMPCCVSAQHKSICIVCHVVRVVAAANSHQCPLKLPNYLIMSLSDSTVINAGVSVEAANHLSLFLTTPGSTATSNQVLHKIVIVDQVGFHLDPLSAKSVWHFKPCLIASMALKPSISKFMPSALSHPCATPVPPLCHPSATLVPPLCHPCATPVPPLCHPCATPAPPLFYPCVCHAGQHHAVSLTLRWS